MASYTCITCRVSFGAADLQRAHYKTDWHRYNLKRKVAALAPVPADGFEERVRAQRGGAGGAEAETNAAAAATYCTVCSKKFATFNACANHLRSRRHRALQREAVEAVGRRVERLNEKNREKGLAAPALDNDALNSAIQRAIKPQPSPAHAKPPDGPGREGPASRTPEPPRLRWFQRRAGKGAGTREQHHDDDLQDGWEDMDSDEEVDSEDPEEMDVLEEEDEGAGAGGGESAPAGAIAVTDCLFCSHHSSSLMKNVAHMTKVHSFFIPDIEFLSDLRGLIKYLGEKVGVGKICLWCNEKGKSFYSTEAVQAHMNDKSHCKLFTEGDAALEFADFYDFRSSYPDYKEGEESEMSEELPAEKNLEYDDDSMELILPSGARIGHRSLMRYYKQKFGASRAVAVAQNQKAVGRVLRHYRALGWTGGTGATLARERDMQYVQRMKSKWMLKTGMSNNATKQMHFRGQVRF
ncbi:zinc finger protein 622 [Ornithorhynchus anatinus]|uniref:Cytoplasmic 60S subunit biogenesis factor ZNF622 n=1 Tax=Ornithorhynchus anatinus TaxID=9258 RepID=F7ESX1_ORNAN|nr:zinc finger protein 622 [Ornithorhynchus anatinus]